MKQQFEAKASAVPFLDLSLSYQQIQEEVESAVIRLMRSGKYILGAEVAELETRIAAYCQTDFAIGVASGSDALLVAMLALGIQPGDEVITTPFTFFATAGSIARLGATPIFVDIDPGTFNLIPEQVQQKVTTKTKAIMPVHLFGQCAEMNALTAIAREHGLAVIEDAAQAIGATYGGKRAGSLGDLGCFSFFPTKNLGCMGDAGIITTNNAELADLCLRLRVHGSVPGNAYYYDLVGCNSRIDTMQAAILLVKLKYLDEWHEARRKNAALYDTLLADVEQVNTPLIAENCQSVYNQYSLVVEKRDQLRAYLSEHDIASAIYYPLPLSLQECFKDCGCRAGDYPNAEYAAKHIVSLPIYPGLSEEMIERVALTIRRFYQEQ